MNSKILVFGVFSVLLSTAACSSITSTPKLEDARFWQRESASSALYMRGPKAQQMLHQDISLCTNDIKELENLGAIREVIPTNYTDGNTIEPRTAEKAELDQWDSPQRDGYLYAEHLDYHDFETCMVNKGWERVDFLPSSDADKAREEYLDNTGRKKKPFGARENVTTLAPSYQTPPPYKNLNE